ncbi:uncharacterized protein LOC107764554 [Nicotiana tabacum]|uniref:Uncharacterized protein LOC107764554 n=1 Tax=Nicotiana tabacum TaxID=4097 RepID=A0A1S3XF54_TOBAC
MADKFVTAHAGAKKTEAMVNDIFAIRQSPGEGFRDFLARFNRVIMSLSNILERMAVSAFQNGLNRSGSRETKKLLNRLMKYPPTTWEEIHNSYYAEVREDEDDLNGPTQQLTSVQMESGKDRRNDNRRDHAGPCLNRERHQPYTRTAAIAPPLPSRYSDGSPMPQIGTHRNERGMPQLLSANNFCVSPSEIVYALEKLSLKVKWPLNMMSDPNTKKSNTLCEFYQERGHKTEDCIALRQEVVNMLNQGNLRDLMSDRERANFARG